MLRVAVRIAHDDFSQIVIFVLLFSCFHNCNVIDLIPGLRFAIHQIILDLHTFNHTNKQTNPERSRFTILVNWYNITVYKFFISTFASEQLQLLEQLLQLLITS